MMALLPFTVFFMWPIGILLTLIWIIQGNWREKWENFKANDGIPYGLFLLSICLIPILGFINSENIPIAWSVLEGHLWFLFTPLIFLTFSPKRWSEKHFRTLMVVFSISEIALLSFFFIRGIYLSLVNSDTIYLYNYFFSYRHHHSYVALYANLVYIFIFQYLINNCERLSGRRKCLLYAIELFITLGIFCLYSRAGILIFLFMHLVWSAYAIYRKRSRWKMMLGLCVAIFGCCSIFIATSPVNRFTMYSTPISNEKDEGKYTDLRLKLWEATCSGIKESFPWGVGTGDGNDVIMEKLVENGYSIQNDHKYNAHNQLLFALLTNGLLGLVVTLLYFITPLATAIKHRDMILLSLFLLLFTNCMVECMFDRRAGVDFFAVMIPLFMVHANMRRIEMSEN